MVSLKQARMAASMVARADGFGSRRSLAGYFLRHALPRVGPGRDELSFRLGGVRWCVRTSASHLGGIHDVWLGAEYDGFDGFRAPPGGIAVDIGANVGAYSLWQWHHVGEGGVVVAVEANPATADTLRRHVAMNSADAVSVVESAVWRERGSVEFAASPRHSSTAGVAATLPEALLEGTTSLQVPALTLGDVFDHEAIGGARVDVTKIDVEGAELAVLEGAGPDVLRRSRRYAIEVDDDSAPGVDAVFDSAGFDRLGRRRNVVFYSAGRNP